jgi:hypothetical protein
MKIVLFILLAFVITTSFSCSVFKEEDDDSNILLMSMGEVSPEKGLDSVPQIPSAAFIGTMGQHFPPIPAFPYF